MACSQVLTGIPAECDNNKGGIREVYIANFADVTGVTVSSTTGTEGMITTITKAAGKKFEKYFFKKNVSSMTSTLNVDPANGINFVQTDLSMTFARQEHVKRLEIAALSLGELVVVVKDANGKYWYLGEEEFVSATAGTGETGTTRTDGNKYTITLTDYSSTYPREVDPDIISGLFTASN